MLDDIGMERARAAVEAHLHDNTPIITVAGGKAPPAPFWPDMEDEAHHRAKHHTTTTMMMKTTSMSMGMTNLPAHHRFRQG